MRFIIDCLHDLLFFIARGQTLTPGYIPCSAAKISEQWGSMKALNIDLQTLLFHSRTLQRSRTDLSTNHNPQRPRSIYQSPFQTTGITNIHRSLLCLFSFRQAYHQIPRRIKPTHQLPTYILSYPMAYPQYLRL